jgi:hypothetical protein
MPDLETELASLEIRDDKGRIHVADPVVVSNALKIIELYKVYHEKYTDQPPRISYKSLLHFYKAALLAVSKDISVEELVARQFKRMSQIGVYRTNCIDSEKMLDESLKTVDLTLDELRRYQANIELYTSRTKLYGSELALRDSTNEFSPLFRVVMAYKLGLKETIDAYYAAALTEYQTSPIAKEVFKGELGFFNPADIPEGY